MSTFKLNALQHKSIMQSGQIGKVSEYSLRNQNVLRIPPTKSYTPGDSSIEFQIDNAHFARNMSMNNIELEVEYEVITSTQLRSAGPYSYADGTGGNAWITPNLIAPDVFSRFSPYLVSPSNSALDSFIVNKSFSNIKITNGASDLLEDARTPENIDIMTCLMSQKRMEEWGIYPDFLKGKYTDKSGGDMELKRLSFAPDNESLSWNNIYAKGCSPKETLNENIFWLRNKNGHYINETQNTQFRLSSTNQWTDGRRPYESSYPAANLYATNTEDPINYINYEQPRQRLAMGGNGNNGLTYPYLCFPTPVGNENVFYTTQGVQQKNNYRVFEDLMGDIFATKYQDNADYRPLPSSQLKFVFTILPQAQLNALFKTSNTTISNVSVVIKSMKLNIRTFDWGLLNLAPSTYYVPFYKSKRDDQLLLLNPYVAPGPPSPTEVKIQTLKYNVIPEYLLFYASESIQTNKNQNQNLNLTRISTLKLAIDNDLGTALFNLSEKELKEMTAKNLGRNLENIHGLFKKQALLCGGVTEALYEYAAAETYQNMGRNVFGKFVTEGLHMADQPFLTLYLLKIGEDIRIDNSVIPCLNRPTNFNFTLTFETPYSVDANPGTQRLTNFTCIAFAPSYYIMNPDAGLIKAQEISISEEEFYQMTRNTNDKINELQIEPSNQVSYTSHNPNLMLGSGWFSVIRGALPVLSTIGSLVGRITPNSTVGKVASTVGTVSDFADSALKKFGLGVRSKKLNPKRINKKTTS